MATIRTAWKTPVALVGLLLLSMAPGLASATPCGPEDDRTIESRWTGVYDTECHGECEAPTWRLEMEAVEGPKGTWYKARVERDEKVTMLAGVLPEGLVDPEEWGFEQHKSPLSKLGGAAVMAWMGEQMKTPEIEFAGWVSDVKLPVDVPEGGKGGGEGAVPEPTAALLFGAGFALTALRRRAGA